MNTFPLRIEIWPQDRIWLAQSPELEVMTQGYTAEEAFHNINEALELFVEGCQEMGTLDQVLAESGIDPEKAALIKAHRSTLAREECPA